MLTQYTCSMYVMRMAYAHTQRSPASAVSRRREKKKIFTRISIHNLIAFICHGTIFCSSSNFAIHTAATVGIYMCFVLCLVLVPVHLFKTITGTILLFAFYFVFDFFFSFAAL